MSVCNDNSPLRLTDVEHLKPLKSVRLMGHNNLPCDSGVQRKTNTRKNNERVRLVHTEEVIEKTKKPGWSRVLCIGNNALERIECRI